MTDRDDAESSLPLGKNLWPILDASAGECVSDAVARLRATRATPFHLRHNDLVLPVQAGVDPDDVEGIFRRVRHRREQARAKAVVSLVGGPYDRRVNVSADGPSMILVGPTRVPYVAVSDPNTEERLCYAHLTPAP